MPEYNAQYTSKGVGNAALATGIIGTSLGALSSAGGLAGIFGIGPNGRGGDPNDKPVTRYEMSLLKENMELKAERYTDHKAEGLQAQIGQVSNNITGILGVLQQQGTQIAQLFSVTKFVIPNTSVAPGWGPADVRPVPPFPPYPYPYPFPPAPPVQSDGTTASTNTGTGT
jgi:hypothetical protein